MLIQKESPKLTGYTIRFVAFHEDGDPALDKQATASTTITGLCTVVVSESDIQIPKTYPNVHIIFHRC